ncbi:MAG: NAD(P)/FAD-dependent oxidoreductase [Spirochaetales bacterium]|nr:NAD(P)/FAD-dependent oxidoreductase [Spirochaetales bacterium]
MTVAVIGGGAAGFFAALSVKEHHPGASVVILEKSNEVLCKVKISGGGRCNVTNGERSVRELAKAYPRGGNSLKKAFGVFGTGDTVEWFTRRGVPLVVQADNCVFPVSQKSQSIIDCFLNQARACGIEVRRNRAVCALKNSGDVWTVQYAGDTEATDSFDRVIVATGGCPKLSGFDWLIRLGHSIENPVPSLFTFSIPDEGLRSLQGIVVEKVLGALVSTALQAEGTLLITHWGVSGPVVLRLSSYGARYLHDRGYDVRLRINWTGIRDNDVIAADLIDAAREHRGKLLAGYRPFQLSDRLWRYLIGKTGLSLTKKWGELGKKDIQKMASVLSNDEYPVDGKAAFKDEFVTCGGVSLKDINMTTMQSRVCPGLYFAGEVLDIDGITGGYNFQAAWTTGYVAGKLL